MPSAPESRSDVFFMVLSAAIFGYFGFFMSWAHQYTAPTATPPNQWLPMVAVLEWTLKGGAVAFALAAILAFAGVRFGSFLYALAGVITSLAFLAVAIWEWTNPHNYYSGISPFLLLIFAAWNGYGSMISLREWLRSNRAAAGAAGGAGESRGNPYAS